MTMQDPNDPTLLQPPPTPPQGSGRSSGRGFGVDDPTALEPPPPAQRADTDDPTLLQPPPATGRGSFGGALDTGAPDDRTALDPPRAAAPTGAGSTGVVRSTPTTALEASDLDARPGSFIGGYEVVRTLGRGGMGIVYLARDPRLGRTVALKVLPMTAATQESAVARFGREAKAIATLDHPAIRPIYGHGRDEQARVFWLAMGFVDGRPYDDVVKEVGLGHESPRRAARVVADAARAIAFAHRKGVIHRDLKPSNIMLETSAATGTSSGAGGLKVHVLDFGLARLDGAAELTVEGQVMGTLRFMPPEQALGAEASALSDVYSLGATLFWALTGEGPYDVQRIENLQLRLARGDAARRPTALRPDVPKDLEAIVLKTLELEPTDRYAGADALADDLERFLAGEPVRARPPSPWRELRRRARRGAWVLAPLALVLLAAGLLVGTVALRRRAADAALAAIAADWSDGASLEELLRARERYLAADLEAGSAEAAAAATAARARIEGTLLPARLAEARAELDAALAGWIGRPTSPGQPATPRERLAPEGVLVAAKALWSRGAKLRDEHFMRPLPDPALVAEADALATRAMQLLGLAEGEAIPRVATDAATLVTSEGERALAGGGPEPLPAWGVIRTAARHHVASARVFDPLDVLDGFPAPPLVPDRDGRLWGDMILVAAPGRTFLIEADEVSVGDFARFLRDEAGYRSDACWEGARPEPGRLVALMERVDRDDRDRPMTDVTLAEARAYARWRRRRLPTAAEWRTAAGLVPWRATPAPGRAVDGPPRARAEPPWDVSPCGARNLAGNVAEWVEPDPEATTDRAPHALGGSSRDVGLSLDAWPLRGAKRSDAVGFRCAADLPPSAGGRR
jgi:serine/threonine protein kinase